LVRHPVTEAHAPGFDDERVLEDLSAVGEDVCLERSSPAFDADERHRMMNVDYPVVHPIRRAHAERQEVTGDFPPTEDVLLDRGCPALERTFRAKATDQKAERVEARRWVDVGHGALYSNTPARRKRDVRNLRNLRDLSSQGAGNAARSADQRVLPSRPRR